VLRAASGRRKPKPTMNGVEKSDLSIVPTNEAGEQSGEARGGAGGGK
jgi:hypothetical protein